jgi:hypothetical protein
MFNPLSPEQLVVNHVICKAVNLQLPVAYKLMILQEATVDLLL